MLFNEVMMTKSLEAFAEKVFKKHSINNVDVKDVAKMIIDELEKLARKKGGTSVGLGIEDEELEKAIIKAPSMLENWKKSKAKEKKAEAKTEKKADTKLTISKEKPKNTKVEKVVAQADTKEQTKLFDFLSNL